MSVGSRASMVGYMGDKDWLSQTGMPMRSTERADNESMSHALNRISAAGVRFDKHPLPYPSYLLFPTSDPT